MKSSAFRVLQTAFCALLTAFAVGCGRTLFPVFQPSDFSVTHMVAHTPVKDCGSWPASWIYATLGLIESERIAVGDSLCLSATYLIRCHAQQLVSSGAKTLDFLGSPYDCIGLLHRFGALTYACYRPAPSLTYQRYQQCARKNNIQLVCDTGFAYVPNAIGLYGAVYTPHDFMQSLYIDKAYEGYIVSSNVPCSMSINAAAVGDALTMPYQSIPATSVVNLVQTTLRSGHSLVWMGNTACGRFSSQAGYAYLDKQDDSAAKHSSASSYCMQLVGMAQCLSNKSPDGSHTFYICKDSRGDSTRFKGYVYLSEAYLQQATMALYRHKPDVTRFSN